MNSGKNEYSFLWFIENYSYCGREMFDKLNSPEFTFKGRECTSWSLCFYPGCIKYKKGAFDSVTLKRSTHDTGPENFSLNLEISLITADGSTLYSKKCEHVFKKGAERGFNAFVNMDELYLRRNTECLPRDTLGVRCRMWNDEGNVRRVEQCSFRTRIGIENVSILHRVKNFSSLNLRETKVLQIPIESKSGCVLSSILYIDNALAGNETVISKIVPSDKNYILYRRKISLLNVFGNFIECGEIDYRFLDFNEDLKKLYQSLTKKFILSKSNEYLPNDELSMLCECTFAISVEHVKLEENLREIPIKTFNHGYQKAIGENNSKIVEKFSAPPLVSRHLERNLYNQSLSSIRLNANALSAKSNTLSTRHFISYNQMTNENPLKGKCKVSEILSRFPSVQDDFIALFNDQLLTDLVLKTPTKSFPTHKIVLCARSSVFRAMLTNDMKEKNSDCIKVEDLENETVQRLLLFLYSDSLQELQWESAIQLYYAADKYAIEKLKFLCSYFLVDNLNTCTASELLLLADTHSDTELKKIVEDFILEHEREVFGSYEWEKLIETNPQLVIKTMHLKYKREKEGK